MHCPGKSNVPEGQIKIVHRRTGKEQRCERGRRKRHMHRVGKPVKKKVRYREEARRSKRGKGHRTHEGNEKANQKSTKENLFVERLEQEANLLFNAWSIGLHPGRFIYQGEK